MMKDDCNASVRSVQRQDEHYPQIQGILSIEVDRITKLDMMSISPYDALSVEIRVRNVAKKTMQVRASIDGSAEWNEVKHMPVVIGLASSNPTNRISLSLYRQMVSNNIACDQIGYLSLHLHSIIRSSPGPRTFQMFNDHEMLIGHLSVRLIFHYGMFGFGHSPQISMASSLSPEQYIMSTLMPRLRPPKSRFEPLHYTMKPRIVSHPQYIPFRSRAIFSRRKTGGGEIEIHPHLASSLTRLEDMANTYLNISSRVQRLAYIAKQFQGDTAEGELAPPSRYTTSRALAASSTVGNTPDVVDDFVSKMEPWLNARHNLKSQVKAVTKAAQFLTRTTGATNSKEPKSKRASMSSTKRRRSSQGSHQSAAGEAQRWHFVRVIITSMQHAWSWIQSSALTAISISRTPSGPDAAAAVTINRTSDPPATTVNKTISSPAGAARGHQPKQAWAGQSIDTKRAVMTVIPK